MPVTAPTLTITDKQDGSGALAQLAGGDAGSTHTVYSCEAFAEAGVPWTNRGSRVGNGSLDLSVPFGLHWFYASASGASDQAISNLVLSNVTRGTESLQQRILLALQSLLQGLFANDIPRGNIAVVPCVEYQTGPLPCVQIAAVLKEQMPADEGTNLRDDVAYPCQVSFFCQELPAPEETAGPLLLWRERLFRAIHQQRLPGVPEVFCCHVEPGDPVDRESWIQERLWLASATLWCKCRVPRT